MLFLLFNLQSDRVFVIKINNHLSNMTIDWLDLMTHCVINVQAFWRMWFQYAVHIASINRLKVIFMMFFTLKTKNISFDLNQTKSLFTYAWISWTLVGLLSKRINSFFMRGKKKHEELRWKLMIFRYCSAFRNRFFIVSSIRLFAFVSLCMVWFRLDFNL